jgi:hypothetical protein
MREYILCISPIRFWDVIYTTRNLSDDSEIVTCSLKGPEEIFVMKSVPYQEERDVFTRETMENETSLSISRTSDAPEFCLAETTITDPSQSTTRAEMRLSEIRP